MKIKRVLFNPDMSNVQLYYLSSDCACLERNWCITYQRRSKSLLVSILSKIFSHLKYLILSFLIKKNVDEIKFSRMSYFFLKVHFTRTFLFCGSHCDYCKSHC